MLNILSIKTYPIKIHFGYFYDTFSYPTSIFAAYARSKGCNVELGLYTPLDTEKTIRKKLTLSNPDLIALSFMLHYRDEAFLVARIAHELGIKVVAGGVHPSTCPEDLQKSGYFDGIIIGDGLGIFDDIINNYTYLNNTVLRGKINSDDTLYFNRYFNTEQEEIIRKSKTYELLTSFGCPYACSFCSSDSAIGFKMFKPDVIVDALEKAKETYEIENVFLWDNTFTTSLKRIKILRKKIEERNLKFRFNVQARTSNFTDTIAEELKRLGVSNIAFGVESGSNRMLRFLNKRSTVEDTIQSAALCKKHGIAFEMFLMVGLPNQTTEDYDSTVELVQLVKPQKVYVSYFIPYPGSKMFDYCIKNDFMPDNWSFHRYFQKENNSGGEKYQRIFAGLKKVDYEKAIYYQNKIENVVKGLNPI